MGIFTKNEKLHFGKKNLTFWFLGIFQQILHPGPDPVLEFFGKES